MMSGIGCAPPVVSSWLMTAVLSVRPAVCEASCCVDAGLPPAPQLPLPPGLDSAAAVPYQQKPIDLFKAIFEASDSEDEADEEEVDASRKPEQQADDKPKAQAAGLQPDTHRDATEGTLLALQQFELKNCPSCVLALPSHVL